LVWLASCTYPLPDHCCNNEGDLTCREKGRTFCNCCKVDADGCTNKKPKPGKKNRNGVVCDWEPGATEGSALSLEAETGAWE